MIAHTAYIGGEGEYKDIDLDFFRDAENFLTTVFPFIGRCEVVPRLNFEEAMLKRSIMEMHMRIMYDAGALFDEAEKEAEKQGYSLLVGFLKGFLEDYDRSLLPGGYDGKVVIVEDFSYEKRSPLEMIISLAHEVGHFAGLEHHANCIMQEELPDEFEELDFCGGCAEKILSYAKCEIQ